MGPRIGQYLKTVPKPVLDDLEDLSSMDPLPVPFIHLAYWVLALSRCAPPKVIAIPRHLAETYYLPI